MVAASSHPTSLVYRHCIAASPHTSSHPQRYNPDRQVPTHDNGTAIIKNVFVFIMTKHFSMTEVCRMCQT